MIIAHMNRSESSWRFLVERARREPHLILSGLLTLLNGYWHKLKFLLMWKRVRIGKRFRVSGTLRIIGSGRVVIGDDCFIQGKFFRPVTFLTTLPEARIDIGDNVTFNGTVIQCFERVSIGNWCSLADAYIVDSRAHLLSADRRSFFARDIPSAPVVLEENIWVSTRVVICSGVRIGRNSVVGACSLVRKDIASDTFQAGQPAKLIKPVPATRETVTSNHV